jgi:hypothetical protein
MRNETVITNWTSQRLQRVPVSYTVRVIWTGGEV